MDVSDVLRDRAQPASGLQRMAAASLLGHLAVLAIIVVAPGRLFGEAAPEPRSVMTISLGTGAEGPKTGGLTSIGGRAIQEATSPSAKPEPATPAAAATPSMTLPERGKPAKAPTTVVKNAPADARGRTASRGAETLPGTAVIETGARGQGFGLSSSGGSGGSRIHLDVDFCCPDYLLMMRDRIQQNATLKDETSATVVIRFSIERDGTLKDPYVERRSGVDRLDIAAQRAVIQTAKLSPLPAAYTYLLLVVHLTFDKQGAMTINLIPRPTARPIAAAAMIAIVAGASLLAGPSAAPVTPQQQPPDVAVTIKIGDATAPPRLAILDFLPLTTKPEIVEAARTIGRVFYDDIEFEREFSIVERGIVATIPAPTSMTDIPFDRWREVNVDGVALGTVRECRAGEPASCPAGGIHVEVRLFGINSRQSVYSGAWEGVIRSQRLFAHRAADELHKQQRNLDGVAQTRLTFNTDRDGQRLPTIENRTAKEIYFCDYDGENQTRVTSGLALNINSKWSPDRQSLVYVSFKLGLPNIFVSHIFQGLPPQQLTSNTGNNVTPIFSPDGRRIAFSSNRTGNFEIFVMNIDGSQVRQLTTNTADDITPTWSPSGTQIAFTSGRTGTPQIFVMDADGLNQRQITHEAGADRATWSSGNTNEIAYAGQNGPGSDVKVYEVATGQIRQLTHGEGSNESPSFAPNGRHIAFTSTRAGKEQLFVMHRDGTGLKQLTRTGNNRQADWSLAPPIQTPPAPQAR